MRSNIVSMFDRLRFEDVESNNLFSSFVLLLVERGTNCYRRHLNLVKSYSTGLAHLKMVFLPKNSRLCCSSYVLMFLCLCSYHDITDSCHVNVRKACTVWRHLLLVSKEIIQLISNISWCYHSATSRNYFLA